MFALASRKGLNFGLAAIVNLRLLISGMAKAEGIVPKQLCSPFGSYPNPLGITEDDRASFHPVVKFPTIEADSSGGRVQIPDVTIRDNTRPNELVYIVTEEQQRQRREEVKLQGSATRHNSGSPDFNVGRYDEDRRGMYISELFAKDAAPRTVHIGIDLGGPIGTDVHSFADGVVHSVGYNPDLGDYGHVIVIEHTIQSTGAKVWALYGHLDESTVKRGNAPGTAIKKGQVIGRLGDIWENGGW